MNVQIEQARRDDRFRKIAMLGILGDLDLSPRADANDLVVLDQDYRSFDRFATVNKSFRGQRQHAAIVNARGWIAYFGLLGMTLVMSSHTIQCGFSGIAPWRA